MAIESIVPVKFVKLNNLAITPTRQKIGDAGYDLYATENVRVKPMSRALVSTGLSIEVPEGYYARIAPRSGLAVKNGIDVLAGVVDSSYRGEVKVLVINNTDDDYTILEGDKIAQLIMERCANAEIDICCDSDSDDDLDQTSRGNKGFGSTGN